MLRAEQTALEEASRLPPEERAVFDEIVRRGNSPQIALICLSQRAPMMGESDRSFGESRRQHMLRHLGSNQDQLVQQAQRAGVSTDGKYYVGGLGRPTDPAAWVSTIDDVKRVLKARNLESSGLVKHKAVEMPPSKPVALAPDLVKRETDNEIRRSKRLREQMLKGKVKRQDIEQKVIHKYGNRKALAASGT